MRKYFIPGVLLFIIAVCGCRSSEPCPPRPDDATGYLQKICLHIVNNKLHVDPAKPAEYKVKRTEERTDNGRAVVWVFLNCCGMGDIAIFDKNTGELIKFQAGAY